jgi:protoheme IX farnesyltransferase
VPMLPSVTTLHATAVRMVAYSLVVWALTLVFAPVAGMGAIYLISALVLGAVFTAMCLVVLRTESANAAMRLFSYSITYITLLFAAMAVDVLVRYGV